MTLAGLRTVAIVFVLCGTVEWWAVTRLIGAVS